MTLDELIRVAFDAYDDQNTEWDAMRAAVLAVLEAVERECVPSREPITSVDWDVGHARCRAEVLRRIQTMRE